ncbi:MAG: methyltransferase [Thermoplasmata archaeon]|nr:methyltransferase [Thermoplasmata archaeon]
MLHRRTLAQPVAVSGRVYPPREDTWLLAPFAASAKPGERVIEVGAGSGELSVRAAETGAFVVATDLNRTALEATRALAREHGVQVALLLTDLASGTRGFHRVLANPPYLPSTGSLESENRADRLALDGGRDGCRVTARLLREMPARLLPGGAFYLLVSSLQHPGRIARLLATWRSDVGPVRWVAERRLEGERLFVVELRRTTATAPGSRAGASAGDGGGRRRSGGRAGPGGRGRRGSPAPRARTRTLR